MAGPPTAGSQAFSVAFFIKIFIDLFFQCAIMFPVMSEMNFEQLKEDLQTRICQWADELNRNPSYPHLDKVMDMGGRKWVYSRDEEIPDAAWNDLDQLCNIVCETVNDFKRKKVFDK